MTEKQQQPIRRVTITIEGENKLFGISGHLQEVYSLCSKYHTRIINDAEAIPLTPALTAHYTAISAKTGKSVSELVARDLAALHRKRAAREEKRVWKEIEMERL